MSDIWGLTQITPGIWLFCLTVVMTATILQRLSGQAFGMVSAPLIALVAPGFLPTSLLLLGLTVGLTSAALDFSEINRAEALPGFTGRALGAIVAALIAANLPDVNWIAAFIGVVVLISIGLSLFGVSATIRPLTLLLAGFSAGIMGTLTAIGAPPMALLYQHHPAKRARAMQNMFFFWGMMVSLLALGWQGLIRVEHLKFALLLSPAVVLGLIIVIPLAHRFERATIRPYALALAGVSALILLGRVSFG
jgi:uncharacterized protein